MGQSCCQNSANPQSEINHPEEYLNNCFQDDFVINSQTYQSKINELENNIQIQLEIMNQLNSAIQILADKIEQQNKKLEEKQELKQNEKIDDN